MVNCALPADLEWDCLEVEMIQLHLHAAVASGGVISRTCNFGVISRTFLKRVNFEILFLHINFCSCHFQRTGLKLLEPVVRTGLPLIIKKLEDFV